MKLQELRIGSLVQYDKQIYKITGLGGWRVSMKQEGKGTCFANIDVLNPIPLTEKWLFKFGFKTSDGPESVFYSIEFDEVAKYKFEIGRTKGSDVFYFKTTCFIVQIKYVHQLQNLYYTLTGKELTL